MISRQDSGGTSRMMLEEEEEETTMLQEDWGEKQKFGRGDAPMFANYLHPPCCAIVLQARRAVSRRPSNELVIWLGWHWHDVGEVMVIMGSATLRRNCHGVVISRVHRISHWRIDSIDVVGRGRESPRSRQSSIGDFTVRTPKTGRSLEIKPEGFSWKARNFQHGCLRDRNEFHQHCQG